MPCKVKWISANKVLKNYINGGRKYISYLEMFAEVNPAFIYSG